MPPGGGPRGTRRALLGAAALAAAGDVLSGCSGVWTDAFRTLAPPRLRIALVGFPAMAGSALARALQQCAKLYGRRGGPVSLRIQTDTLPEMGWYKCGAKCSPATMLPNTALFTTGPTAPQLQIPVGGGILVRGRTALGVRFGGALPVPVAAIGSDLRATGPDLVLAYSTWQYWLAPRTRSRRRSGIRGCAMPPRWPTLQGIST